MEMNVVAVKEIISLAKAMKQLKVYFIQKCFNNLAILIPKRRNFSPNLILKIRKN